MRSLKPVTPEEAMAVWSSIKNPSARSVAREGEVGAPPAEDAGRCAREIAQLPQAAPPRRHQGAPKGRPLPGTFASGWKHRMDGRRSLDSIWSPS
jgi:hypothetical protein